MSTQRLNVTLPDNVIEILKTKKNKSEFLSEAVMEKAINDKKKEIVEKANRLRAYYKTRDDLNSLAALDSQDFMERE
ncbi:MAG: hypothetical protein ACYDAO_04625 [Thermoplasmataceae archaeon]